MGVQNIVQTPLMKTWETPVVLNQQPLLKTVQTPMILNEQPLMKSVILNEQPLLKTVQTPVLINQQPLLKTVQTVAEVTGQLTPGYVAANHGAVHTAPMPEGPSNDGFFASHHINLPNAKA